MQQTKFGFALDESNSLQIYALFLSREGHSFSCAKKVCL